MIHVYINNNSNKTLIMLHGTGGNENDMIGLAKRIDKNANILSIRGRIVENGMNRYFKRLGIGIYDLESYQHETNHLIQSLLHFSNQYNFTLENATIVGFSNGANIALGVIQTNPIINNYVLLSPVYINPNQNFKDLTNKKIFISTADDDPYVNNENMGLLIDRLTTNNSELFVYKGSGHQISLEVLSNVIKWHQAN